MIPESSNLVVFTHEDLRSMTGDFSPRNLVGTTEFGKLYRGFAKPDKYVTVKLWDESLNFVSEEAFILKLKEEMQFLSQPIMDGHPNLVKLIGFCCKGEVRSVVYDLNPKDTLHNFIIKDEVSWIQRIEIILQLARLLEFLHGQENPHMLLNLCYSNIVLDLDCNPRLCDFGLGNGLRNDAKNNMAMPVGCYGDPYYALKGACRQTSSDVFALGLIVVGLLAKRVCDPKKAISSVDDMIHCWAKREYRPNHSLAHQSLTEHWGYDSRDGVTITEVALHCIEFFPENRPVAKTVVDRLESLAVLQRLRDNRPSKRDKRYNGNSSDN